MATLIKLLSSRPCSTNFNFYAQVNLNLSARENTDVSKWEIQTVWLRNPFVFVRKRGSRRTGNQVVLSRENGGAYVYLLEEIKTTKEKKKHLIKIGYRDVAFQISPHPHRKDVNNDGDHEKRQELD